MDSGGGCVARRGTHPHKITTDRDASETVGETKWVMVVFASDDVIQTVLEALPDAGFRFLMARNLEEFRRRLLIVIPDLIILDLQNRATKWREALGIAASATPQVPILTLVDPGLTKAEHISALAGGGGVFLKPLDPRMLAKRISGVLFRG